MMNIKKMFKIIYKTGHGHFADLKNVQLHSY